jgi:hypothetical protein
LARQINSSETGVDVRTTTALILGGGCLVGLLVVAHPGAQTPAPPQTPGRPPAGPAPALYKLEDAFLRWPLPADDKAYGAIDGKRLHQCVEEDARTAWHQMRAEMRR